MAKIPACKYGKPERFAWFEAALSPFATRGQTNLTFAATGPLTAI